MATCVKIKNKHRQVCVGAMRQKVTIQVRSITEPTGATPTDYSETFTDFKTVWAYVESVSGETMFDQTNTERVVTHNIYIRYLANISAETWLQYDNEKYDILDVQDYDKRHEFIVLKVTNRGLKTNQATFA